MAEPATDHDSLELQTSSQQEDEAHIQEHATLTERTHLLRRKLRLEVSSNCITGIPDKILSAKWREAVAHLVISIDYQ